MLLGISLLVLITLSFPLVLKADQDIKVKVDNKVIDFKQPPFLEKGRTMVPIRAPLEALGCTVRWDAENQAATVTNGANLLVFISGSNAYLVNGSEKYMDIAPRIINGRMACPIRYAAEGVGARVEWDPGSQTVNITTREQMVPAEKNPTAAEIMDQADKAARAKNACKFSEKTLTRTNTSVVTSWGGKDVSTDIVYDKSDGVKQYGPLVKYEKINQEIPSPDGKKIDEQSSYEKASTNDGVFIKSSEGVWVKSDEQTEEDLMKDLGLSEEQLNREIDFSLEKDEIRSGRECWVVSFSPKTGFFKPIMDKMIDKALALSGIDSSNVRDCRDQMQRNMKIDMSGKTWVDKTSGLEIYEESKFNVKFNINMPIPDSGGHTVQFSYDMQESSNTDYSDWGKPIDLPDLSKTLSPEDYAKLQSSLAGSGKA